MDREFVARLSRRWNELYSVPPIAHVVREEYAGNWIRFYYLPEGKRLPANGAELTIALGRCNDLFEAAFGCSAEVVLITTHCSDQKTEPVDTPAVCGGSCHWMSVPLDETEPEAGYFHLYARHLAWRRGVLDSILSRVAADQITNMLILSESRPILVHPYDGGVDFILFDVDDYHRLATRYSSWRSKRSDGP